MSLLPLSCWLLLWAIAVTAQPAAAAPYRPQSDAQVLETLPTRFNDARQRELRELRQAAAAQPGDAEIAARLARAYFAQAAGDGDPRHVGHAQAALAAWWEQAAPPPAVRVMRAVIRQFGHEFDAARADLQAVVAIEPDNAEAWAWLAAIALVQADYAQARSACQRLAGLAPALIGAACLAQVDAVTGRSADAARALAAALAVAADVDADQRLWALTRLAETEQRRGQAAAAETAFQQALALGIDDVYLQAAYADFLLDQGRSAEVLTLLKGSERSDLLLLRLALAAKTLGAGEAAAWRAELAARFDAARLRGDKLHQKEESRFALALLGQPERALTLAVDNFALQREPADARALLEAALAAKQPAAAMPALQWLASSGYDGLKLNQLAKTLKGGS